MAKKDLPEVPVPEMRPAAVRALQAFAARLTEFLRVQAQGLRFVPNAPETGWENLPMEEGERGLLIFSHVAMDRLGGAPTEAATVSAVVGTIFPVGPLDACAGEKNLRLQEALRGFEEPALDKDAGFIVSMVHDKTRLALSTESREVFALCFSIALKPVVEEKAEG